MAKRTESTVSVSVTEAQKLPGQVVLVLQGGGALGAYQGGIYEALHEAGIEPNWVIGTSIGAINAGIIAGNPADKRLDQLRKFWTTMEYKPWWGNSRFSSHGWAAGAFSRILPTSRPT
jgi:NTE family protein